MEERGGLRAGGGVLQEVTRAERTRARGPVVGYDIADGGGVAATSKHGEQGPGVRVSGRF